VTVQHRRPFHRIVFILTAVLLWGVALCFLASPVQAAAPDSSDPCYARVESTGATFTGTISSLPRASGLVGIASINLSAVQQAVDAARAGDLVKLAGTCQRVHPRAGTNQVVYITSTLTLAGGYTTTNWTTPDPAANPTTLDAVGLGRVLFITGTAPVTLTDLIVTNGVISTTASGAESCGYGGGVRSHGPLALVNLDVIRNTACERGGGVYAEGAVTLSGGRFEDNRSEAHGGGLFAEDAMDVTGTEFVSNTAYYAGGGVAAMGTATVRGALFAGNEAEHQFGGGLVSGSAVDLTDTVFLNNSAPGGGGLSWFGTATLNGGRFEGNRADIFGGGLWPRMMTPVTLTGTQFVSNKIGRAHV
jgi:predicted outer membrane repeat protein